MIELVVLDFDGTLCQTEESTFNLMNNVAYEMGYTEMSRLGLSKSYGNPFEKIVSDNFPGVDLETFMKKVHSKMDKYINENGYDIIPQENIETLKKLREKNKKIAILTSRGISEIRHLLDENHPISQHIDAFYHKDNLDFMKPDPRVFDKVLSDFEVASENSVYVGDFIGDAIAANGAGMHFIAILESGIRTKNYFKNQNVDFFVDKFPDIIPYILNH